jgi:BirA family biotin operon repressor/biotin-[acetyl-CoA-carboxylase] ligase
LTELVVLDEAASTNDVAWERGHGLADDADGADADGGGADGGGERAPRVLLVVLARRQTAGRGRAGRLWESPAGSGLYASFYLRPHWPPARASLLTLAAGLAVRDACRAFGVVPALKWPNDLLAPDGSGRKLAGILTETRSEKGVVREAVVGVGLNLVPPPGGWPAELARGVVTLAELTATAADAAPPAPEDLARAIVPALDAALERLARDGGARALVAEARAASDLWGRRVEVEEGRRVTHGTAKDWADDGGLVVRLDSGSELVVHAGDVRVRWDEP